MIGGRREAIEHLDPVFAAIAPELGTSRAPRAMRAAIPAPIGDQTLFMRADMVEQAWRIVQPVLDAWAT
jgi:hypothetical protein